jgi:predicted RNase H-like HicB family nuclease
MWPIKEITVTLLQIEPDDWFAYLPDAPDLHARGGTAKEAFRELHTLLLSQHQHDIPLHALPLYKYTFNCTEVNIPF